MSTARINFILKRTESKSEGLVHAERMRHVKVEALFAIPPELHVNSLLVEVVRQLEVLLARLSHATAKVCLLVAMGDEVHYLRWLTRACRAGRAAKSAARRGSLEELIAFRYELLLVLEANIRLLELAIGPRRRPRTSLVDHREVDMDLPRLLRLRQVGCIDDGAVLASC